MRPFEADRRVYLVFHAHLMNEDAADALLKDLEEPPDYATVVLVANELGPLPETIRSRCQLVPFRRLSERAVRAEVERRAPGLDAAEQRAIARLAAGRLDRVERLLDPQAAARRARAARHRPRRLPRSRVRRGRRGAAPSSRVRASARARRRPSWRRASRGSTCPRARSTSSCKRAARGAEREQLLLALEELAAWFRDLIAVAAGAPDVAVHADRIEELAQDATPRAPAGRRARGRAHPCALAPPRGAQPAGESRARGALHRAPPRARGHSNRVIPGPRTSDKTPR